MRLSGRIAPVTGGSSGFGHATAERFVAAGATTTVTGRNEAALGRAAQRLGAGAIALRSDMLGAVLFLASHDASDVQGAEISAGGGPRGATRRAPTFQA